jgi:hypothetical protein
MSQIALFRCATLGSLFLAWLAVAVDFLPGMVPANVLAAVESNLQPGDLFPAAVASIGITVVSIAATLGLVFFQPWSRPLALVTTLASLAVYPFVPAMPQSGWASMLFYLSAFAWGVALALAYHSPLSARFAR